VASDVAELVDCLKHGASRAIAQGTVIVEAPMLSFSFQARDVKNKEWGVIDITRSHYFEGISMLAVESVRTRRP